MANINDYDDVYKYAQDQAEENEEFWGTDLNSDKAERMNRIRSICIKLTDLDRAIIYDPLPFDNTNRNGGGRIRIPGVFFISDKRISDLLAELYKEADAVWMAAPQGEISLTFDVLDVWNEHGTIRDRKRKK